MKQVKYLKILCDDTEMCDDTEEKRPKNAKNIKR